MKTSGLPSLVLVSFLIISGAANGADLVKALPEVGQTTGLPGSQALSGRASVVDGRTLWFPRYGVQVRLAGIDACELPQWSFEPDPHVATDRQLKPVPCGAFAKAWLKRTIGTRQVECSAEGDRLLFVGRCRVGGRDLGLELLSVGWAKVSSGATPTGAYGLAERRAKAARYGMWGTYVLDMEEWRAQAIDRTNSRRPIADLNLLRNRRSEISPPFADARRLPSRTDR
ncbi:thermonuclease family protein [Rhizobium sp. 21-4511-3d]